MSGIVIAAQVLSMEPSLMTTVKKRPVLSQLLQIFGMEK